MSGNYARGLAGHDQFDAEAFADEVAAKDDEDAASGVTSPGNDGRRSEDGA